MAHRVHVVWAGDGTTRRKRIKGRRLKVQLFDSSPPSPRGGRAGQVLELDDNDEIKVAHLFADVFYIRHEF
jgi:hypothetical protein